MSRPVRTAGRILETLASQCGFRPDRLTVGWVLGGVLSLQLFLVVRRQEDPVVTTLYFLATSAFYYLGNAFALASRSAGARGLDGEAAERAWQAYQRLVGLMFFNQALGFTAVSSVSFPGSTLPISRELAWSAGGSLLLAGLIIKTWATLVVGVDCFYYKDLFFRRRLWQRSRRGPYALLANPMYGVGNLHLHGLALLARSLPGLLAALFCHAAIYAFDHVLERPFVRQIDSGGERPVP